MRNHGSGPKRSAPSEQTRGHGRRGPLTADDLRREWGGKGAGALGLAGPPDYEQFKRLIHGLDPDTGEQLTAKLVEHRIPAWDVNRHCSKGVTVALERGGTRIQGAFWVAAREAMADTETQATTRVRKGGQQEDRVTGNLVWYAVEHPETRPAAGLLHGEHEVAEGLVADGGHEFLSCLST